jgi:hypothetical protein
MKKDNITGLKINGKTYKEGITYQDFRAPTFLLSDRFASTTAILSITPRRLEITYSDLESNTVGKLAAKGKAVAKGKGNIASDFRIKNLMEVSYVPIAGSRRLNRNKSTLDSPVRFKTSYDFLVNNPLSSQLGRFQKVGDVIRYSTTVSFDPFTDPSFKREFRPLFSGFTAAFKNDWWASVLPGTVG